MVKENYVTLDLMKLFCAFLVVAIHTVNRDTVVGYSIVAFARVAVPFFFISSGYFYYDKLQISNTDTKKIKIISHLKKLTKIYVLWSAMYFIIDYQQFIDNTLIKNVVKIIRYFFVIGIHAHLWFLSALIVCTLIISLIYYRWRINLKYIFGGSIILYLVAAAGDMYSVFFDSEIIYRVYYIYNNFFGETWNSFMAGLIFFTMGMLIRENRVKYKLGFTKRRNLILVLTGVILLIAESIILKKYMGVKDNNLSLLLMPLVPLMFLLLKEINLNISGGRIQLIRNVSLMIYLIHPMIKVIIINIGLYYSIDVFTHNSSILFTVVSLFSLVFSLFYGYYKLNKSCGLIGFFRGLM